MARKNPFEKLMGSTTSEAGSVDSGYVATGATRSIMNTLDELADRADKLLEGETIVELDPDLIDPSFLRDRLEEDPKADAELLEAIQARGQETPILVRPHPADPSRYMVVFGNRRRKAAKHLGRKVRAVVKDMSDKQHAVAQGQENSARANLSFIERALLATELVKLNYDKDNKTVRSALSIDNATLSKMLLVSKIPNDLLLRIGPAKRVGRDRWYELKHLLEKPSNLKAAISIASEKSFAELSSDDRFNRVLLTLKKAKTGKQKSPATRSWKSDDQMVDFETSKRGKKFTVTFKSNTNGGTQFGDYVSTRLEALYREFKEQSS